MLLSSNFFEKIGHIFNYAAAARTLGRFSPVQHFEPRE
jgi:hypothetical protein